MGGAFDARARERLASSRLRVSEVLPLMDELGIATVPKNLEVLHAEAVFRCDVTEVRVLGEALGPIFVRAFTPPWTLERRRIR